MINSIVIITGVSLAYQLHHFIEEKPDAHIVTVTAIVIKP